jgi:hypothetical protein
LLPLCQSGHGPGPGPDPPDYHPGQIHINKIIIFAIFWARPTK